MGNMAKEIRMSCDDDADDSVVVTCRQDCLDVATYMDVELAGYVIIERSKAITLAKSILDYYGELDD